MCQFYNASSFFGNAAFFASLIEIWNWFDKNAACILDLTMLTS